MKNRLKSKQLQNAVAVSGTTTYNSAAVDIECIDNVSFQIVGTSTATGSAKVQVSFDYNQDSQGNVLNAGNWITKSTTAIDFGTSLTYEIELNQSPAPYVRLSYTNATNTGTLSVWVGGKALSE